MLERMPESVGVYDREARVVFINHKTEHLFGKSLAELAGRRLWDVFPASTGNAFHRAFLRVAETGRPESFENYYAPWRQWFENDMFLIGEHVCVVAREITQRKTAEEHLRMALGAAKMIAWAWESDTDVVTTLGELSTIYGVPEVKTPEQGFRMLHPDDVERHRSTVESVKGSGGTYRSEFRIVQPDGSIRWLEEHAQALREQDRTRYTGVVMDISSRKQDGAERESMLARALESEARFRHLNARLEAVVEGSPIGIAVFDRELRFVRVNRALAEINGQAVEQHLGREFAEVLPEAAQNLSAHYRHALETGEAVLGLPVSSWDHGKLRHFEVSVYPVQVQGQVEGVVGMVREVTHRKNEERRRDVLARFSQVLSGALGMRETAEQLVSLFVPEWAEHASVHLRRDDGTDELLSTSRPAAPPDPLSGTAVHMMHHGRLLGTITLGLASGAPPLRSEQMYLLTEVASRAAIAIENARLYEVAQTERQRAQAANRAKDEFLAVLSHELRTPLNAILGWSRLLLSQSLGEAQQQKAMVTIERNARSQAKLIEELLDYSRIVSGQLKLELQTLQLSAVADAALEVVKPAAEAKGVELHIELESRLEPMLGDPHRLQQAIWNLLTNAVRFTPRGGRVTLRLERSGDDYVLSVSDTGSGIDPAFLPQVFERFRQAEMGPRRRHGGLGLGLAIVRQIVELHGGSVEAFSAGLDQGATFRITLPRLGPAASDAPLEPIPQRNTPVDPRHGELIAGLSVLAVDDEPDARELLSSILSAHGAEVQSAASADEALQILSSRRFDVIVSDIGMPGKDGYDLIEQVRAAGTGTPAVALTAYARSADRAKALGSGFNAHLTKPLDPGQLLSVLVSLSGRSGSENTQS
jgi:PAS domain S-box-containing protein